MIHTVSPALELSGELCVPADKSIAQRAALFSLLCEQPCTIEGYPLAEDPQTALRCIELLGAGIHREGSTVHIEGTGRSGLPGEISEIDCGNSGTVMRLLAGILAGGCVATRLTGDASLSRRPMGRIMEPLKRMGAGVRSAPEGRPPLHIDAGKPLSALCFEMPVPSAQLKSAVLLAGLFTDEPTVVVESLPSRNHTELMLQLPVEKRAGLTRITSHRNLGIPVQNLFIPGDFSSAAFWMVAATIVPGSDVLIRNCGLNPSRSAAMGLLRRMGADITVHQPRRQGHEPVGDIRVRSSDLRPVEVTPQEIANAIDELPVLFVAMAFADGMSSVRGAGELRIKESDRLDAMHSVLQSAGIPSIIHPDGIDIPGASQRTISAADYDSRHDHRIAMAAAILSLRADGPSRIHGADAASVSYAGFWNDLTNLTAS